MKTNCLRGSALAGTIVLSALFQLPSGAQTNLLQNGDFNTLAPDASLPPWTLTGSAYPVVSDPVVESDFGALLRPAVAGEQATLSQEIAVPGGLPGPTRVLLSAHVKRGGADAALPQISLHFGDGTSGALLSTPTPVPLDDAFHLVQWTTLLPPLPETFTFEAQATAGPTPAIQWHFDDCDLQALPVQIQVNPPRAAPGEQVQINSPAIGPGWQATIGGQPAPVVFAAPGQLVCTVPPPPPTYNPNLFQPVSAIDPIGGQTLTDPVAFSYRLPLLIDGAAPLIVSSAGGTQVQVTGQNFPADLLLTDLSNPSRPPFPPDVIGSGSKFIFTTPPTAPPQSNWQAGSPTAPAQFAFFSLQVEDPPIVEGAFPENAPPSGGTPVTIAGFGFQPGAQVFFDSDPVATTFVSPTELQIVTDPHQMQRMAVTVVNPSGVPCPEPGTFTYLEGVRADVNGNERADPEDVLLALDAVLSDLAAEPLNLGADVDGDQRLGLPEAVAALNFSEAGSAGAAFIDLPTVQLSSTHALAGDSVFAFVTSVQYPYALTVFWGDDDALPLTEDQDMQPLPHVYERPGTYQVRLLWSQGFTDAVEITILPQPSLTGATMQLNGTDELGAPVTGRSGRLDPAEPATVSIGLNALHLTAAGLALDGHVQLSGPGMDGRIDLPWHIDLTPAGGGAGTASTDVLLPLAELPAPGEYYAKLVIDSAIDGTGVVPPEPVTFSLDGFVTEEDCHELEREWQDKRLEKDTKKNDCEELAKRLEECRQKKADLEAARTAAMGALADLDTEIADKQADYDALFASVNQFLSGVGTLMSYPAGGGIPPGGQFAGARKGGASAGVGIQFGDAHSLLDRMDLYKKVNGHSIGKDLNTLRNCIAQIDGLQAQKAAKEAEIADLDAQIAAIDADIAAKEAALAACLAECDALEQDLDDFAQAHADKLVQLERQRETEAGIGESERRADDLEGKPDLVDEAADAADKTIDGRAGTPGQTQDDKDKVTTGRSCAEIARQKIAEARQKQAEARDALAMGDTATADQKTAEANTLLDEATQKLKDGSDSIRSGHSSASRRKRRQCADGEFIMGTPTCRTVWTSITDLALAPMGVSPEKWASTLANAQGVLDGLSDFFEFLGLLEEVTDRVGVDIPIGGAFTPDPAETAQAIVNAWLEIFKMTQPYDVWAEITGHTKWFRTDMRCVNGCKTYEHVEWEDNDVVKKRAKIGTIWGGDKASREAQLQKILQRPQLPSK